MTEHATSQRVQFGSGSGLAPTSVHDSAKECPSMEKTPAKRHYTTMARRPIAPATLMGRRGQRPDRSSWHILDQSGSPLCRRLQDWEIVDQYLFREINYDDPVCRVCHGRYSWQPVAHDTELVDLGYETPCRVWTRGTQGAGYGSRGLDGKNRLTHREAFEQEHGAIPEGYVLHHLCGQKRCLEVDHMVAISRAEHCKIHRPGDHRVYG